MNVYLLLVHHQWINYRWLPSKEDVILTGVSLSQKALTGKTTISSTRIFFFIRLAYVPQIRSEFVKTAFNSIPPYSWNKIQHLTRIRQDNCI